MNSHSTKILFVEGEEREIKLVEKLTRIFFSGKNKVDIIPIATANNIYMLWQIISKEKYDFDIIEIIRDNIPNAAQKLVNYTRQNVDEIFLFFDYDLQQKNLPSYIDANQVISDMISTFDNETEIGKLYISYPMVEAVRDFVKNNCQPFTNCVLKKEDVEKRKYKTKTGSSDNPNININHYSIDNWKKMIEVFGLRVKCLFENYNLNYRYYREKISSSSIWQKQYSTYVINDEIFVLSAFPEFLLDYFPENFFVSNTRVNKPKYDICPKNNRSALPKSK